MLRGLVALGGLVAAAGLAAEVIAPGVVEAGIEQTVRDRTDETTRVEARTGGRPFLPPLLLDGEVERIDIELDEVAGYELRTATVSLRGEGIQLDRAAMYRGDVEITGLETGSVAIELHEEELAELAGSPVELDPQLVEFAGSALEVAGSTVLEVPVDSDLMPCSPQLEVDPPLLRLSCTFEGVPGVLRTIQEDSR